MALVVVTDTGDLDFSPGLAALAAAGHEGIVLETTDPDRIAARAAGAAGLITSYTTVDRALLDRLPEVRVIATTTVGLDRIDLAAAAERGIPVHNLPGLAAEEVALHALAGMLALIRELPASDVEASTGTWDYNRIPLPPRLSELTLGLVGLGRIARQLVRMATPLVARIVAHDPGLPATDWPAGVEPVDLATLFATADVLSLHAPSNRDTVGLVNTATLATMRPGSYLVNVARGDLVVTADLLAALDGGTLRGAFLDVVAPEPPAADDPVRRHPRVLRSPHAAFRSAATVRAYVLHPVRTVITALDGDRPAR